MATSRADLILCAVDFGQPIDRLLLQLGREVRVAVPALVRRRIGKAEIGRQINDLGRRRALEQIRDDFLRRAVRQRAENQIEPRAPPSRRRRARVSCRQVERRELRKHLGHRLAGAAVGGQQSDLHMRMAQQQPHQFRAGIAGSAEHADFRLADMRSP